MGLIRRLFPQLRKGARLSSVLPTKQLALLAFGWSCFYLLLWPNSNAWFAVVPYVLMTTKGMDISVVNGLILSVLWMSYTLFVTSPLYFFMGRNLVIMIYMPLLGVVFYKKSHEKATKAFLFIESVFWDFPLLCWMQLIGCMKGRALHPFHSPLTDAISMGSLPLPADAVLLQKEFNVTLVVNMCREWRGPLREYAACGITQLHLPTPDLCEPEYKHILEGVHVVLQHLERYHTAGATDAGKGEATDGSSVASATASTSASTSTCAGMDTIATATGGSGTGAELQEYTDTYIRASSSGSETNILSNSNSSSVSCPNCVIDGVSQLPKNRVFVHCKAGRGRAATMALCILIACTGLTPDQAMSRLLKKRKVVEPSVREFRVVQKFVTRLEAFDGNFEALYLHDYVLDN
jgi:hypothetical protein